MKLPPKGATVNWRDRKGRGVFSGTVLSTRTTKTGRVWVQVQASPKNRGGYAGQKSIRASQVEEIG